MAPLSSIVSAEAAYLREMLDLREVTVNSNDQDHCSLETDRFRLHFLRQPPGSLISSYFEFHNVPDNERALSKCLHTWLILRSIGEPWPTLEVVSQDSNSVVREMQRIKLALSAINDDQSLLRTLLWEAGYMDGYASWG